MSHPIVINDTDDINHLNRDSLLFARYFSCIIYSYNEIVNNYEIKEIYKKYVDLVLKYGTCSAFRSMILCSMKINTFPLLDHLLSPFNGVTMDWNNFFQFVIFFCLAPQPSVFYMIFNSFPTFEGVVAWEHLIHLFTLIGQQSYIDQLTLATFKTFDLNHDGCLSIVQFCNFASQTSDIFEILYKFRIHLIMIFLQNSSNESVPSKKSKYKTTCYRTILNRKKNLPLIKEYKENNKGKYPDSDCGSKMKYFLTNKPNPNMFDYECDISDISFTDLTIIIIKKYKSNFMYEKEGFSMKYLSSFSTYQEIVDIDKYYITYRAMLPVRGSPSKPGSMNSSTRKESGSIPKAKSILKASATASSILRPNESRNSSLLIRVKPHNYRCSLSQSTQILKNNPNVSVNKTNSAAEANTNLEARVSHDGFNKNASEGNLRAAVSNYEVNSIKRKYQKLRSYPCLYSHFRYRGTTCINSYNILKSLNLKILPFYDYIFQPYQNHGLNWNDFFQLVVFYSLAPSVGVITALFNSFPGTDKKFISWKDIIQFLTLLHTDNLVNEDIKLAFMRLDVNSDGLLSLRQLFQFVQITEELWLPIHNFRVKLISTFLPFYYDILTRKINIGLIKQYQKQHKGKDPKQPCLQSFKNFLLGKPNPNHHDYGCSPSDITLSHVVTTYIKKFNANYHSISNDNFLRNIDPLSSNPILLQIDLFYSNAPRCTNRRNGSSEVLFAEVSARNRSNSNSRNSDKKSVRVMPCPIPRYSNKVSVSTSPNCRCRGKLTMESEGTSTYYNTVHSSSDEHPLNVNSLKVASNSTIVINTAVVSTIDPSTFEDDHSI